MSPEKEKKKKKQYCITFEGPSMYHRNMNSSVVVPLFEGMITGCNKAQMVWLQGNAECSHVVESSDLDG